MYTKVVLTVIAVMLSVIALRPIVSPATTAQAQGGFGSMQVSASGEKATFFDSRTGDYWFYVNGIGNPPFHYRMSRPGGAFTLVK